MSSGSLSGRTAPRSGGVRVSSSANAPRVGEGRRAEGERAEEPAAAGSEVRRAHAISPVFGASILWDARTPSRDRGTARRPWKS